MVNKKFAGLLVLAAGFGCFLWSVRVQARDFTFVLAFGDTGAGMTQNRIQGMFDQLFAVVERKTKIKIVATVKPASPQKSFSTLVNEIMAQMKAKKIDISLFSPGEYGRAKRQGLNIVPWLSMTVNGSKSGKFCIFTKPGATYKSLADLKGQPFIGTDEYLPLKALFVKDGVKDPVYKFLGSMIYNKPSVESFEMVLQGKAAGIAQSAFGFKYLSQQNPKFKSLKPFRCLDSYPHQLIVVQPDLPKAERNTLTQVMLNADRDPDFRAAKWFFLAINGKFFVPDAAILGPFNQFQAQAKANGWAAEEDYFLKNVQPALTKKGG